MAGLEMISQYETFECILVARLCCQVWSRKGIQEIEYRSSHISVFLGSVHHGLNWGAQIESSQVSLGVSPISI